MQLVALVVGRRDAIIGFHFNWWEGRKFLEIPRPLDYLVVVDVLLFIANIGMTDLDGPAHHHHVARALLRAAVGGAAVPARHDRHRLTRPRTRYWRWWVVHLWVEGVWELIMGGILAFLLIKLTGVDREVVEKWLYVIVGFTFLSGILGTGHHYYFIGTPPYWLWIGGVFSALEPLAFLGMAIYAVAHGAEGRAQHPNRMALHVDRGLRASCRSSARASSASRTPSRR